MSHRRGWQERHISCIGPGNAVANDLHCIHKPKPIKRRKCTHKDCEVMWRASAWSAVSYGGLRMWRVVVLKIREYRIIQSQSVLFIFCAKT